MTDWSVEAEQLREGIIILIERSLHRRQPIMLGNLADREGNLRPVTEVMDDAILAFAERYAEEKMRGSDA